MKNSRTCNLFTLLIFLFTFFSLCSLASATIPTYSSNSTNLTIAGSPVEHRMKWDVDTGLSGYIFSWYNGGNWTFSNISSNLESTTVQTKGTLGSNYVAGAFAPQSWGKNSNQWTNPGNVISSDNSRATEGTQNQAEDWYNFSFAVPTGSTINGVNMTFEYSSSVAGTSHSANFNVSNDGGTTYKPGCTMTTSATGDVNTTCGTFTSTWGFSWTTTQINDTAGNGLMIKGTKTDATSGNFRLDTLVVNVNYTGPGDTEANKTYTTYNDVYNNSFLEIIKNISVTVNVTAYSNTGSSGVNSNPDLWLEVYDGSNWIEIGNFSVTGTGNFTKSVAGNNIFSGWNTQTNRDIRIKGMYFDVNDEINYTDVWVSINSTGEFVNDSWTPFVNSTTSTITTVYANPTSDATIGTTGWNNPNNAFVYKTDSAVATTTNGGGTGQQESYYGYSLSIPGDATLLGIGVILNASASSGTGTNQIWVEISCDGGNTWSNSGRTTGDIPATYSNRTFGGNGDLWGLTCAVGASDIRVNVTNGATSTRTMRLDWVGVNVTYRNTTTYWDYGTWANVTKTVNLTKGALIKWCVYANDTSNDWNGTSCSDPFYYNTQEWGNLEVELIQPDVAKLNSVIENRTFFVNATVFCRGGPCGDVNGTLLYNLTYSYPNTAINTTIGEKPFFVNETPAYAMKACLNNPLIDGDFCNVTWVVNASGMVSTDWKIGVFFNSSYPTVQTNNTNNATISIITCTNDFNLGWSNIDFDLLNPSTNNQSAKGNANNLYNITLNYGSCNTDFYIDGSDFQNITYNSVIKVGNISWSNISSDINNGYFTLSTSKSLVKANIPESTNVTTWYWLNAPPVYTGIYNGTIYITGVNYGQAP